jgi:DNA replication protein
MSSRLRPSTPGQSDNPSTGQKHRFAGFPTGARATAVPSQFFSELLPLIEDDAELRVTLYVIYALGRRKGYPRFVTLNELQAEAPLLAALAEGGDAAPLARLQAGLDAASQRGSLLSIDVEHDARVEKLFLLNTPSDRRAVAQLQDGRIDLGRALPPVRVAPTLQRGNVFQLYEENVGPLTPLVAEELREAEQLYPYEWLEEALREAALQNKRSWRYAAAILQRWATEGRTREKAGRDPGEGNSARAQFLRRYRELGGG